MMNIKYGFLSPEKFQNFLWMFSRRVFQWFSWDSVLSHSHNLVTHYCYVQSLDEKNKTLYVHVYIKIPQIYCPSFTHSHFLSHSLTHFCTCSLLCANYFLSIDFCLQFFTYIFFCSANFHILFSLGFFSLLDYMHRIIF